MDETSNTFVSTKGSVFCGYFRWLIIHPYPTDQWNDIVNSLGIEVTQNGIEIVHVLLLLLLESKMIRSVFCVPEQTIGYTPEAALHYGQYFLTRHRSPKQ